jgi:hypothetical protein
MKMISTGFEDDLQILGSLPAKSRALCGIAGNIPKEASRARPIGRAKLRTEHSPARMGGSTSLSHCGLATFLGL